MLSHVDATRRFVLVVALFVALAALVYGRSLAGPFSSYDDRRLIVENPVVTGTLSDGLRAFTTFDPELYIPVTLWSYRLQVMTQGLSASAMRVASLLLHVVVAALGFLVLRRRMSWGLAFGAAALFVVHPLQVEPVAWISGRKDVLSAAFLLGAFFVLDREHPTRARMSWGIALAIFACLSKATAIVLPLFLLASAWTEARRVHRPTIVATSVVALVFACIGIAGKLWRVGDLPIESLPLLWAQYVFWAGRHIMWPYDLTIYYPQETPVFLARPGVLAGIAFVGGVIALIVALRRRAPTVVFCMVFALVALLPALLSFAHGTGVYMAADRTSYLALLGACGLVVLALHAALRRWWIVPMIALGTWWGVLASNQAMFWTDDELLYEHAVQVQPELPLVRSYLDRIREERLTP